MAKELGAVPQPVAERYERLLKVKEGLTSAEAKTRAKENIEKIRLKRWVDMARSKEEAEHAAAVKNAREEKYSKTDLKNADRRFQEAKDKFTAGGATAPDWLKVDVEPQTDVAKEFVARIAELSETQRKDPYVLYREAAKLYWSTEWTSTDMSSEGVKEVRELLERTFQHIREDLVPPNPDFGDTREDVLWKGLDRRFDFYRTHRLDLLPHVSDEAPKDRVTKKVNRDSREYREWANQKEEELQRGKLATLLRTSQDHLDKPEFQDLESKSRLLGQLEGSLRNGVRRSVKEHDISFAEFDEKEAQPFIHKIKAEKNEVDVQLFKAKQAEERKRRYGAPESGSSWINEAIERDASGKDIVENDIFRQEIKELREISKTPEWSQVQAKIDELQGLRNQLGARDLERLDRLWSRAAEYRVKMEGSHWNPSVDEQYRLQTNTDERDKKFYELIAKILDNPNEQAYKQFDLYDKYNYDLFQKIIGRTKDANGKIIGDKLVAHYQNLFDTIMRLSDGEYWAAQPNGDAEGLQKYMNFFRNIFGIEAVSDPLVVHYMQAYEQAFEYARDLHDQLLPNELFALHAGRYEVYVDRLADGLVLQRIRAGAVHDYKRDPRTGLPERDPRFGGKKLALQEQPIAEDVLDSDLYRLRIKAARRMGKGMGIMTMRLTETAAFTRTPGVEIKSDDFNGDFTKEIAFFSSKPYGGITRWHNPMAEWFRMYKFGDTLYPEFFNTIIGPAKGAFAAEKKALAWNMDMVVDVMNIAETGDRELLERKYGHGVVRLMDMVEDFTITGRLGNNSLWGILDSTKGWNDLDRERLGGSMRLSTIQMVADSIVEQEFKERFANRFTDGRWKDTVALQTEWLKAKFGEESGVVERLFNGKLQGIERDEWQKKVKDLGTTYKTWIYTQYVMRNPQGAAAHIFVDYGQKPDGKQYRAKLKSKIFHEIFTPADLEAFGLNELIIERDIATGTSLTDTQYSLMDRLAILDGDLMAVQSYAMDKEFRPRDIQDADFDRCIKGDPIQIKAYKNDGTVTDITIDIETRRRQAREYFKKVQREFFGKALGDAGPGWDVNTWREQLQPYWIDKPGGTERAVSSETHATLRFRGEPKRIAEIYERAQRESTGRLTRKLVDQVHLVHMGTEDVQWGHLDMNVLGDRHYGRIGNDFLTHAKTTQMELEFFHSLTGDPDRDKLIESLQKIGMNEKGWDPQVAARHVSLFYTGMDNVYKQRILGGVPFAGRILPRVFNIPMSLAQKKLGTHYAVAWSMNNRVDNLEKIGKTRTIPYKRIMDGKDYGPYTMQTLQKQTGTSRLLAATEMLIIGYALALVLTAVAATTKSVEEETKH